MKQILRIGTRESKLALLQTDIVVKKLKECIPQLTIEVIPMSTKGDQILNRSLASFGGKGVFTKELEVALLDKSIDIAVHSAKDMPMEFPKGLQMGAVLEREDPSDVLVTMDGTKIADMKEGSVIGTSSLRRELQIKQQNEGVQIRVLRGNVQTRLSKLESGQYDGIILARAGLNRLGVEAYPKTKYHMETLLSERFLPAPGQGILAIECRENDEEVLAILETIHSKEGAEMLFAERAYLQTLNGGCNAPAGAYCRRENGKLVMEAMYAKDGIHTKYAKQELEVESFDSEGDVDSQKSHTDSFAKQLGKNLAEQVNIGKVYLVGAGAGDEGLLTVKARDLLQKADVIVYDSLISTSILQETKVDSEWIYAGKRSNNHHLPQEETNEILWKKAKEGKMVVRLKGGDPFIFGRGAEEALELLEHGVDFEIVSGVSSCYSVPAYAGVPVTDRRYASSFHVITGQEQVGRAVDRVNYEVLAKEEGTLIFLMGVKRLEEICNTLIQYGKDKNTPAGIFSKGTTRQQKFLTGTLETLPKIVKEKGIAMPAIIVIGHVVSFSEQLQWMKGNAHFKKRVLLTGTKLWCEKAKEKIEQFGAQAIPFSLIRVEEEKEEILRPLFQRQEEKKGIEKFEWIVFTSRNGVELFFEQWKKYRRDIRELAKFKFAVIGSGTADTLREYGIEADFVPQKFSSEDMAKEWVKTLSKEERVLLLRAKEGSMALPKALKEASIIYEDIPLYHIVGEEKKREELNRVLKEVDYVAIASGSAGRVFANMIEEGEKEEISYQILSIGKETTKTCENAGLTVHKTANIYSIDGILELLREMP
ncbi:MAG: hydroxymethylbilane synthase [Clostridiales bacterium]|nr:hydroxymethylbilane synthase [Clostridiales bacterium]